MSGDTTKIDAFLISLLALPQPLLSGADKRRHDNSTSNVTNARNAARNKWGVALPT